ncbi:MULTISPECIES: helix-turn-helix domain-containing protein [unclassified Clostridioides]|uniref:helix-turn-helix transcriptional regulator n=1 Tax=unclassified Clostridioides TaxID=2635829 RepID=UPI001D125B39|nr:helix-turn-helix transcriptional regulator [Clostridioides sp. ES-S-0171-01]MCC0689866.1 helix-turn-helix transcriptional regulator [Clostridioides sp. ES-S-0056-01]MCC0716586.1 helix-turn-helix transcriptional regulator [Clostridioides sp. ES-S-0077-01]
MKNYTLKELRKEKKLRQKDVADNIGMKITTYASKENGARRFTVKEALAIAEYFGKDLKEIFLNT